MKKPLVHIDLTEYAEFLNPYKKSRNLYECPVCNGKLSYERSNGEVFTCYSSNCDRSDIRKAILELAGETSTYSDDMYEKREAKKRQIEEQNRERLAALQSETERDTAWKRYLDGTFLTDSHKAEMLRRGWTEEQIVISNARSSAKGRIIPIANANGLFVGSQLILDNGEGKRWHGAEGTNKLKETDELPLLVIYPENPTPNTIAFVEGTLDKPHLLAHQRNVVTIGSSNIGSQPKDLERSIATIKAKLGWSHASFVLYADGGSVANKYITGAYTKLSEQLEGKGRLSVAWWGQFKKSDGDIDEIGLDVKIELISFQQFLVTANKHIKKADDEKLYAELTKLGHTANQSQNEPYLLPLPAPIPGALNIVSSGCGTGKTQQLPAVIDSWLRINEHGRVIDITHRNSIKDGHQRRLSIEEYKTGYGQDFAALNSNSKISICLDSIRNLQIDDIPSGSLVILDEVEAILNHLSRGGTLGSKTADTQAHFAALLSRVLGTGGAVLGLEDSVTNLAIDGLKSIVDTSDKKHRIDLTVNSYERFNWGVNIGAGSVDGFVDRILSNLAAGERICVPTSSQCFGEALEMLVLQQQPDMAPFVARLDAKTAPEQRLLMNDPDAWLKSNPTKLLILSPTVESGFSISEGFFDRRMGYFANLSTRSQIQLLHRNRDNIPTDIFCTHRGAEANSTAKDHRKLLKVREQTSNITSMAAGKGRTKMTAVGHAFNVLDAQFSARDTLSAYHSLDYLTEELTNRGHQITRIDWGKNKEIGSLFKACKQIVKLQENKILFDADPHAYSPETASLLLHSSGITFTKKQEAKRVLLEKSLPRIGWTEEMMFEIVTDKNGLYGRQCEFAYLVDKPELAKYLDQKIYIGQSESAHIIYSRTPKNSQKVSLIAPILHHVEDLATGRGYEKGDAAVEAIAAYALGASYDFWRLMGLNIKAPEKDAGGTIQNTAIAVANKILKKLGYEPKRTSQPTGDDGKRKSVFQCFDLADGAYREQIKAALDIRYQDWQQEKLEEDNATKEERANIEVVVTGLIALVEDVPRSNQLEGLNNLYTIWSPDLMRSASGFIKEIDPSAFARLSELVQERKVA